MTRGMKLAVVVLAAGKGTRMRSNLPKVLHRLGGKPMVEYGIDLAARLSPELPVLVVGHGAEQVQAALGGRCQYVLQAEQLGTAHAVMQAEPAMPADVALVVVFAADMPLLRAETLRRVVAVHMQHEAPMTLLTVYADDPRGFGRVVRAADGGVLAIIEEAEATPEQKTIRELNGGVYCFNAPWLWQALRRIQPSAAKGEYYLTDVVALAAADGCMAAAVVAEDAAELMGVNTRVHLAEAEAVLRERINRQWMLAGVTLIDPKMTYISPDAVVGRDSTLWPGVCLGGPTEVGEGCELGPHAVVVNSRLGAGCRVEAGAILEGIEAAPGTVFAAGQCYHRS